MLTAKIQLQYRLTLSPAHTRNTHNLPYNHMNIWLDSLAIHITLVWSTVPQGKYGWLTCNILIKHLIVSLSGPLHSTAQLTKFVRFPTNMYSTKYTRYKLPTSVVTARVSELTMSIIDI